jgi:hypothetical protein
MLSERFDEWEAQLRLEGRQAGWREGRQEGIREGIREGRKDGEAALLTLLLQKRFGELPDSVRTRLLGAHPDELEHWGERLLEVSSLNDLFMEEPTASGPCAASDIDPPCTVPRIAD